MIAVKVVVGQLPAGTVPDYDALYVLVGIFVFGLDRAGAGIAQAVFPVVLTTVELQRAALNDDIVIEGCRRLWGYNQCKCAQGQHANGREGHY